MKPARARIWAAVVVAVLAFVGTGPAPATAQPPIAPASYYSYSFLQVNTSGTLVYWFWNWTDVAYKPARADGGWGNTKLVTGLLVENQTVWFLEVKGDELVEWAWASNGSSTRYHRDWGWSNARLIAGLDIATFLEVKTDGTLVMWRWSDGLYRPAFYNTGWGATRHIAGMCGSGEWTKFLEVKGDELVEWWWNRYTGAMSRYHRDWGWRNARFVAGLNCDSFVEVQDNGQLWEWNWNGSGYSGVRRDAGWGNTRILG